jgi:hypothetical protein
MTELDELRRAMQATERPADLLDFAEIMVAGRRLRQRRRVLAGGAAALSIVLLSGGIAFGAHRAYDRGPAEPAASAAAASVSPSARVTAPAPSPPARSTHPTPDPNPPVAKEERTALGEVIGAGIRYGDAERVYYAIPLDLPGAPGVRFGLVAGLRYPNGDLTPDLEINDTRGQDRSPGFHSIGYDESITSTTPSTPAFGYFVGPAKRIIGKSGGVEIAATLRTWSEDSAVVIFWFDPKKLTPGVRLDGIVARDADGHLL